ncbi:MAG: transposase [Bacteroidota bacterium]
MVIVKLKFKRQQFSELANSQWQIVKIFFDNGRKRKHNLRAIVNAILKLTRTGCQWRNLDEKYPAWKSVFYYFTKWKKDGSWSKLLAFFS